MGGMIWAISSVLHEETEIDIGWAKYVNDDLVDYMIPVNGDIKHVDVMTLPEEDDALNPAGAKGLGELGHVEPPPLSRMRSFMQLGLVSVSCPSALRNY
jgi:xanthine dehydrogenase YagR molybdenum-binding subunit